MRITHVHITAEDPAAFCEFYEGCLGLPVTRGSDWLEVVAGASHLTIKRGEAFEGVHHLAFGIPPEDFAAARRFLADRVEPVRVDGTDVIDGPEGWASESVYFLGPEGIVLEYIARQADAGAGPGDRAPRVLAISEVGIGVPDVAAAVNQVTDTLDLPRFPPQEPVFAPVGDHDGLLILVDQQRLWFPTKNAPAARGPLEVELSTGLGPQTMELDQARRVTVRVR